MAGDSESSRVARVPSAGTGAWAARSPFPSEDFWAGDSRKWSLSSVVWHMEFILSAREGHAGFFVIPYSIL